MVFLYSHWLSTPLGTRHKIAEQFGFKKVRSTHVSNNEIVDDGFVIKDVEEALSIPNLQNYLDTEESDIIKLWINMIDKIEGREVQADKENVREFGPEATAAKAVVDAFVAETPSEKPKEVKAPKAKKNAKGKKTK